MMDWLMEAAAGTRSEACNNASPKAPWLHLHYCTLTPTEAISGDSPSRTPTEENGCRYRKQWLDATKALRAYDENAALKCTWRQRWLNEAGAKAAKAKYTWQTTMLRLPRKIRLYRSEELILGQLRTGAYPPIGGCVFHAEEKCLACKARVYRSSETPTGKNAVDHVFECPGAAPVRSKFPAVTSASILYTRPYDAVRYVQAFVKHFGSQLDRFNNQDNND